MTIAKQIECARNFLKDGQTLVYAQMMSGSIRAAATNRGAAIVRKAIRDDAAERFFVRLDTSCPLAA